MRTIVLALVLFAAVPVTVVAAQTGGAAPRPIPPGGLSAEGGLSAPAAEEPRAVEAQEDLPTEEPPAAPDEPVQEEQDPADVGVPQDDLEQDDGTGEEAAPIPDTSSGGLPSTGLQLLLLGGFGALLLCGRSWSAPAACADRPEHDLAPDDPRVAGIVTRDHREHQPCRRAAAQGAPDRRGGAPRQADAQQGPPVRVAAAGY